MTIIAPFCFLLFLLECKSAHYYGSFEIVGGDPIEIEKVPFFAIYRGRGGDHGCGASIVSDQFIISAAHCFNGFGYKDAEIVVGTDKINQGEPYDIVAAYPHPKYTEYSHDYDVLVLKLAKKLLFGEKVQPIALAETGMVIEDSAIFQAMGFGVTDPETGSQSNTLLSVNVPYVNDAKCAKAYKRDYTKRMICAGEEGKDSCQNDSGGPLVYKNTLIGIVSFGRSCAMKDFPGVYARVSALRAFIDNVMKEHA